MGGIPKRRDCMLVIDRDIVGRGGWVFSDKIIRSCDSAS